MLFCWAPHTSQLKLNFDSSCKGNSSWAGGGGILRDDKGGPILAHVVNLGIQTSQFSDEVMLYHEILLDKEICFNKIINEGDSKNIITMLKGLAFFGWLLRDLIF